VCDRIEEEHVKAYWKSNPGSGLSRRAVLVGGASALVVPGEISIAAAQTGDEPAEPRPEYFEARNEILRGRTVRAGRVKLDLPRISESGNSVPLHVSVETKMTEKDHVRTIHILSEQNPFAVVGRFHFTLGGAKPDVETKIRLATTQRVHAIAEMGDGQLYEGVAETVVALAACLD
jgi:sulfur-oxidizing protein SoxY